MAISNREAGRRHQKRRREWMDKLKSRPCTDCRHKFPPICMDFDHVRGKKLFPVGWAKRKRKSLLLKEIAKCDLVCANCHRIRTEKRRKQ